MSYLPSGIALRGARSQHAQAKSRTAVERELISQLSRRDGRSPDEISKLVGRPVNWVIATLRIADTLSALEIETLRALIKKRGVTSVRAKIAELCDGPVKRTGSRCDVTKVKRYDDAPEAALGPEV
jgi:hypothetical protein